MEERRYLSLFVHAQNVHLVKDVGMIPYVLYQEFGYHATIACYRNGTYPYLDKEVKGLRVKFIRRLFNHSFADSVVFLLMNARKFDVLHLTWLCRSHLLLLCLFKILTFGKGKTYLKLDADEGYFQHLMDNLNGMSRYLVRSVDVISSENKTHCRKLSQRWGRQVNYIPNGFYDHGKVKATGPKMNKILTCGRIGTRQKATEVLCEAFARVAPVMPDWTLELVGPVEPDFKPYISGYFEMHPHLVDKVIFTGEITSREEISARYREAKIFVLSSRWEGFPLVFPEALEAGCYIVSTNIQPAADVTGGGEYGGVFAMDDIAELGMILEKAVSATHNPDIFAQRIQEFAYDNFYWVTICGSLHKLLYQEA